jgi:hypothetical protein
MANKVRTKGTVLQMEISSVYTTIPQVKNLSLSGEQATSYETVTLDQSGAHTGRELTGYTTPLTISGEMFLDPQDATHAAYAALLTAPVTTNFKVVYVDDDTTPTEDIYVGNGFTLDKTIDPSDGLSAPFSIETSGAPA